MMTKNGRNKPKIVFKIIILPSNDIVKCNKKEGNGKTFS